MTTIHQKCDICGKEDLTVYDLQDHIRESHSTHDEYSCKTCNHSQRIPYELSANRQWFCNNCNNYTFWSKPKIHRKCKRLALLVFIVVSIAFFYRCIVTGAKTTDILKLVTKNIPEATEIGADIIFIHGLEGGWKTTWTHFDNFHKHKDNKATFFGDLLSTDIVLKRYNLRIWSFGYDNAVLKYSNHAAIPLKERAQNLLLYIWSSDIMKNKDKPIIFIAHSMGGLVIKSAMLEAQKYKVKSVVSKYDFYTIYQRTNGIIFYATPHFGAGLAYFIANIPILSNILGQSVMDLEHLKHELMDLNKDFVRIITEKNMTVLNLYETKPSVFNFKVVESHSADIHGALSISKPLGYNHMDICKPADHKDIRYTVARTYVQTNLDQVGKSLDEQCAQ